MYYCFKFTGNVLLIQILECTIIFRMEHTKFVKATHVGCKHGDRCRVQSSEIYHVLSTPPIT